MPWQNGPSRTSTTEWKKLRAPILERDGHRCTAIQNDGTRCPETEPLVVDHIINYASGGTDDDTNLQTLCKWHHDRKTAKEAAAARKPRVDQSKHPAEIHPGLRRSR